MRGLFIVFEGLDRSGKSTQVNNLVSHLNAIRISFPDRNLPTGRIINSYLTSQANLDDHAVHLLFSANRWERCRFIVDTLNSGTHIVCDRYAYSGVAYTMSKGLGKEWCMAPDAGLPKPDLVFFLTADPESLASRGSYGEERYEKVEFQRKVKKNYEEILGCQDNVHYINALETLESIASQIKGVVEEAITKCASKSIEELW